MKTLTPPLILLLVLLFSCGQDQQNNRDFAEYDYDSETYFEEDIESDYNTPKNNMTPSDGNIPKLKGYKVMSKQFGIPVGIMPIPKNWKIKRNSKDGIQFESNDGVKVYGERFISYFYSSNQQLNYNTQQGGRRVAPVKNLNRVLQEDIFPYAKSQGMTLLNQFPLQALAQFDKRFDSYLFKGIPENKQFQCVALEWEDKNGGKSIGVIRYFTTHYPTAGGMDWGYTLNAMGAPKHNYETAKKAFINSLVNFQINPQWVKTNNNFYAQQSRQGAAQHQQRMAAINAQGQANRNLANTYSSIPDSSFESWKRRNNMNSSGHSKSVNNGIWERSTISNPNTGQQYYAEGQNDYYWVNQNNEYMGTDNSLYNPNIDNTMNTQEWTQYNNQN